MLKFTRGDTFAFKFQRRDENNEIMTNKAEKIFFTIKANHDTKDILVQKTLENGITFDLDGTYHIRLENEDTRNLKYDTYVCDIQVITDNYIKTIFSDTIKLDKEVTFDYE